MIDAGCALTKEDYHVYDTIRGKNIILVLNKSDKVKKGFDLKKPESWSQMPSVTISALYNKNLDKLKNLIATVSMGDFRLEGRNTIVPNLRHKKALDRSLQAATSAVEGLQAKAPAELIAIDIKDAVDSLGEVIGLTVKEDILDQIFSRFCIGK
jgi:tRNA modification GTPase